MVADDDEGSAASGLPDGIEFVVGHILLTSLFAVLVVVYAATVRYHVVPL